MAKRPTFWTDEMIAQLRELHAEGLSASEIAAKMDAPSRNAVIGKLSRLGIKSLAGERKSPSQRPKRHRRTTNTTWPFAPVAVTPIEAPIKIEGGVSLLDLQSHHCRSVEGVGDDGIARYCGTTKAGMVKGLVGRAFESPYCTEHSALYYRQPVVAAQYGAA